MAVTNFRSLWSEGGDDMCGSKIYQSHFRFLSAILNPSLHYWAVFLLLTPPNGRLPLLRIHLTLVAFSVYLGSFVFLQSYRWISFSLLTLHVSLWRLRNFLLTSATNRNLTTLSSVVTCVTCVTILISCWRSRTMSSLSSANTLLNAAVCTAWIELFIEESRFHDKFEIAECVWRDLASCLIRVPFFLRGRLYPRPSCQFDRGL